MEPGKQILSPRSQFSTHFVKKRYFDITAISGSDFQGSLAILANLLQKCICGCGLGLAIFWRDLVALPRLYSYLAVYILKRVEICLRIGSD